MRHEHFGEKYYEQCRDDDDRGKCPRVGQRDVPAAGEPEIHRPSQQR